MLDLQVIRDQPEIVAENCRRRGVAANVDHVLELDARRRQLIHEVETLRHRQKEVQAAVRKEADPARNQHLIDEGRQLKEHVHTGEQQLRQVQDDLHREWEKIPNLTHPDAPVGKDPADNRELRRWSRIPQFDFQPRDHVELGQSLDLLDFDAGARVAGTGFYFLKNEAVLLELALVRYAIDELLRDGFTAMVTPDLARDEVLTGIGFSPRGPETQIYSIEGMDLSLIATAEITLGGLVGEKILNESQLPIKLVGLSHCFRTEAGAHGRATRGLFRVHQFTKVEMFAFTKPEQSDEMLEHLVACQERLFQGLGIPYRVVDTCTGDLGAPAYRKYDLEAWMPGRVLAEGTGQRAEGRPGAAEAQKPEASSPRSSPRSPLHRGAWGEVTSASNCTDYQARRLGTRFRQGSSGGTQFVHTLNGTAIAVSRTLIAILENYQQADGSVIVPPVLVPWVGKDRIVPR